MSIIKDLSLKSQKYDGEISSFVHTRVHAVQLFLSSNRITQEFTPNSRPDLWSWHGEFLCKFSATQIVESIKAGLSFLMSMTFLYGRKNETYLSNGCSPLNDCYATSSFWYFVSLSKRREVLLSNKNMKNKTKKKSSLERFSSPPFLLQRIDWQRKLERELFEVHKAKKNTALKILIIFLCASFFSLSQQSNLGWGEQWGASNLPFYSQNGQAAFPQKEMTLALLGIDFRSWCTSLQSPFSSTVNMDLCQCCHNCTNQAEP